MKKNGLIAKTLSVKDLTPENISQMFGVFSKYYEKISIQTFKSDLSKKDDVIILLNRETKEIKGFSTLVSYSFELEGEKVEGIFSGDTIVEKEYWGGTSLHKAFSSYMMKKKLKNPLKPLYWFLISKGYKTYLLLTNNFSEHFPRYDQETPFEIKKIMDKFASDLYPQNYNPQTGLIEFSDLHDHLKDHVAPITEEMKNHSPQIKYFAEKNKSWKEGSELVCLANFDLMVPVNFALKTFRKRLGLWDKNIFKIMFGLKDKRNV